MNKDVSYRKNDFVAIITLEKGDLRNAIDVQLVEEVKDIKKKISMDRDIRVIVITGNETFSVGTERDERALFENKAERIRALSITSIIEQFDQPSIAAINGDAIGQSLELTLACDFRMCTETAYFAMNQVTYGDIPWDGGTQRLSRVVGRGKTMEMILTGEAIDAQEAHRIGLVHKVVPEAELMPAAMDMAQEIATKSPIALRYTKEAINKGMDLTLEQGLRLEADLYFLLHTTRDRTEGIRAFQEKRTPVFEGR
jgi:enoyl-CoA hydratase/carnithine racemase